jgi:hypothetical protein
VDLYTLDYNEIKKQNSQMIDEIQDRIALERDTGPFNNREYKWDDILVDLEILLPEEEDYLKYLEIKQQNNDFSFYSNTTVVQNSSKSKPIKSKSAASGYPSQQINEEEIKDENNEVKNEDENKAFDCDEPSQAIKDEYPSQVYSSEIYPSLEEGKYNLEDGKNFLVEEEENPNDNDENIKNEEGNPNNKQESLEDFENFDANGQNNSNEKLKSRIFMEDMVCQVCNDGDYSEDNLIVFCAV